MKVSFSRFELICAASCNYGEKRQRIKKTNCARTLADKGATIISLMGTSLSFYRGPECNAQLVKAMQAATGLPCTTMTSAVIDALEQVGGTRVSIATAYTDELNPPLVHYLEASGFTVENLESLNLLRVEDVLKVTDPELMTLCKRTADTAPEADAIFLSCGGLHTAAVTQPLKNRTGLPLVSSAMAGAWGVVRLAKLESRVAGYGRLFEV